MKRALVVDDNVALATNLGELLESLDLEVAIASDADAAIAEVRVRPVELALVDVGLPLGVSGVELVPLLRDACPGVEIIMVTGHASVDSAVAAVRQGIFAYVQKPFVSTDLLALVTRALAQIDSRRDRERLAAELERSESMYRSLVETIDAAILVLDRRRTLTFANRSARRLLDPGSGLEGRTFVEVAVADAERGRVDRFIDERDRDRSSATVEVVDRSVPSPRTIRWSILPTPSSQGEGYLAVGVDLTEVRELQRRNVEAEALGAIGTLTTGLAHEIRNPLNAASLQLELLVRAARKVPDASVREGMEQRVRIVRDELGRLERMLAEFLALARPRALTREPLDVATLFDGVVELEGPVAETQGAVVRHTVARGALEVSVDASRMKQVLINLVGNALDALRSTGGGTVALEASRLTDGAIELRVVDDGPGVDAGAQDVFDPFVTTKEGGTGLGLSIVRNIVEKHGGTVTLAGGPDGGTVARVVLPAR